MPTLRAAAAALAFLTLTTLVAAPSSATASTAGAGISAAAVNPSAVNPSAAGDADTERTRAERSGRVDRASAQAATGASTDATPGATERSNAKATASSDGSRVASLATTSVPGGFHALPAHRLLDTRSGLGAPKAAVAAGSMVSFQVAGRQGVPSVGVGAVALSITVLGPTGSGALSAYPAGSTAWTPWAIHYAAGDVVANLVVTRLSADGRAEVRVGGSGSTQLVADVVGWVEAGDATEPGAYAPVAPARLLDTRVGTGAPKAIVPGGTTLTVPVAGHAGVPATGVGSVLLNVTATGGTANGTVTVGRTLEGTVTTSNLSYLAGKTRSNFVAVPLSNAGTVDLRVTSTGSVHAIADVVGWVRAGAPVADGTMTAVPATRVLDTRSDGGGAVSNLGWASIPASGSPEVPASGVHAVLLNVTTTQATAQGRVSILPSASNLPTGSQIQFTKGRNDATLVVAPVSADGWTDLFVQSSGSVHLVAEVVGYVAGPPVDTEPPSPVSSLVVTQPTKNSVTLTWENPTDADFTGVTIRRVVDGATSSDPFEGTVVAETTGTSFTDNNLTPGTTYGYSVWAHDSFPNVTYPVEVSPATTPLTWSAPVRVAPLLGAPRAISCVTTTWCMAGDASGQVLTWNGAAWSAPKRAVAVADGEEDAGIGSLSCVSSSFCTAVAARGGLVTYRSGVWSAPTQIKSSTGATLVAATVDCTSTTFCVAVGQDDDWKGWAARFNGTSWTTATKLTASVGQIDCVSTTFCMAVGQDMYAAGWAARWNGSTWTSTKIQPNGSSTYDVSCVTASFCMATSSGGRSVRWNGSTWSALAGFDRTNGFQGYTVVCTATTFCLTVDSERGYVRWNGTSWGAITKFGPPYGFSLSCVSTTCIGVEGRGRYTRFNGSAWSTLTTFDPTRGGIVDLSCGAATNCLATDKRGKAYRWNGTSWSAPVAISWTAGYVSCASSTWCLTLATPQRTYRTLSGSTWSSTIAAPAGFLAPDCPVPGWCVAFDTVGRVSVFNGSTWSAPRTVFSNGGSAAWTTVECLSKSFCLAYDQVAGHWSRWNGATWSTPRDLNSAASRGGVMSCATTTMCVAVEEDGSSFRFDGATWRRLPAVPNDQYSLEGVADLSCPTTTFCTALLRGGSIATFNGATWNRTPQETGLYDVWDKPADGVYHLECPSTYACTVAGHVRVVTSH